MIAFYTRYSTEKKRDKDGKIIQQQTDSLQVHAFKEYKLKHGISDDQTCEYRETRAYSGTDINRPQFNKLLNDIQQGRIARVVVFEESRLARNLVYKLEVLVAFKKYNVVVESIVEGIQSLDDPNTQMLVVMQGVISQRMRELTSIRTKMKLAEVRANGSKSGKLIGAQLGNTNRRGKLKAYSQEQIQLVKDLRRDGLSYRAIAHYAKCSATKVIQILRRELIQELA